MAYTFQHGDRPLEGYAIQRAVGQGGFGEVYYAISDGGREVALKYLKSNPEIELRGVSQCMNLKSPYLVSIFDVKQSAEGDYFIVMEYISGPSLRDLLVAEPNGLGPQKAAYLLREIGKGLSYLHDRGIVHRDLKPGNIFYEDGYVKIGDYGLSKFISVSRHSAQTASVGTVHYMAPEVGSGNYSRGIDIYALGVMFYEMLLGRVPFEGSSMGEVLMKHLTAQPEVDELPARFGEVIRKALAKDINDRYATVEEMVEDVFGEEDVRASMVGFNPSSLSGVARRATAQMQASPVPSPNPRGLAETVPLVGRGEPGDEPRVTEPVRRPWETSPERLGKRLTKKAQRIDSKIQRKMDKLAGRESPKGVALPKTTRERRERMVLSGIMAFGLTVGVAILFGATGHAEEVWITSALLVPAMSGGLLAANGLLRRMSSSSHANWARRLVTFACCVPLMAVACAPMMSSFDHDTQGAALLGGLLMAAVLSDWQERLRSGARGELSAGSAISVGMFALILAAIFSGGDEPAYYQAGVVAAAVSLIIQAFGWLVPSLDTPRTAQAAKDDAEGAAGQGTDGQPSVHAFAFAVGGSADAPNQSPTPVTADHGGGAPNSQDVPLGVPVQQQFRRAKMASNHPLPPPRWGVFRAFWGLVAFCLFGGAVVAFVANVVPGSLDHDDRAISLIAGIASFSLMVFALRKTTLRKRVTAWRETVRPFLLSVALTGIGGFIVLLCLPAPVHVFNTVTHFPNGAMDITVLSQTPEGWLAFAIVGLVLSGTLLLLLLVVLRGRNTPPQYQPAQAYQTTGSLAKVVLLMALMGTLALVALLLASFVG